MPIARGRVGNAILKGCAVDDFNVSNHPMFGAPGFNQPDTELGFAGFGKVSPQTTNLALGGGGAAGGQSPLYALGGPRSAQFTLKLLF
jgi:hypothetical protein